MEIDFPMDASWQGLARGCASHLFFHPGAAYHPHTTSRPVAGTSLSSLGASVPRCLKRPVLSAPNHDSRMQILPCSTPEWDRPQGQANASQGQAKAKLLSLSSHAPPRVGTTKEADSASVVGRGARNGKGRPIIGSGAPACMACMAPPRAGAGDLALEPGLAVGV
jgi:hypothetical protein